MRARSPLCCDLARDIFPAAAAAEPIPIEDVAAVRATLHATNPPATEPLIWSRVLEAQHVCLRCCGEMIKAKIAVDRLTLTHIIS